MGDSSFRPEHIVVRHTKTDPATAPSRPETHFFVIDVRLLANIGGNLYHGDSDRFGVDNPQMKYSLATVGLKVQIHFTN